MPRFRLAAAAVIAGAAALAVAPAGASDPKPVFTCGLFVKDSDKDSSEPNSVPPGAVHDNMEIKGFFLEHKPDRGAEATTVNIVVKDLKAEVPQGNTAVNWTFEWKSGETVRFVRAVYDYSGATAFEWGEFAATGAPAGVSGSYQYRGDTTGELYEGADGVVKIVIPQDVDGKAGTALTGLTASANTGKSVVPVAATTPSRGVAYENDSVTGKAWTVAACTPDPPVVEQGGSSTGGGGRSTTTGSDAPLPVKLVTTRAKRSKKLRLKVRSTEQVTRLVAQLRKRGKVVARGRLAKLSGTARLTLKARKKLKKGTYVLDLAGTDASGRHRLTAARLKVR